jgi:hypothetical protein
VKIVPWTSTTRSEAFQALRARVATERIELVNDEQLVAELLRVRTRFRAGASVVEIGRVGDSHGDLGLALAAAVLALDRRGSPRPLRTSSAFRGLPPQRRHPTDMDTLARQLGLPQTNGRTAIYRRGDGTIRQVTDETWRPWRRSR